MMSMTACYEISSWRDDRDVDTVWSQRSTSWFWRHSLTHGSDHDIINYRYDAHIRILLARQHKKITLVIRRFSIFHYDYINM